MIDKTTAVKNAQTFIQVLELLQGAAQHINPYQDAEDYQREVAGVLSWCMRELVPQSARPQIGFVRCEKEACNAR